MFRPFSLHPAADAGARPRRSFIARRWYFIVLLTLCVFGVVYAAFQYVIWTMPVDSFTFIEREDLNGQVIRNITSTDSYEANLLRQQINNQRDMNTGWPGPLAAPGGCPATVTSTIPDPSIVDFRYTFSWRGFLIEVVQGGGACHTGQATAGDLTFQVDFMPVIPKVYEQYAAFSAVPEVTPSGASPEPIGGSCSDLTCPILTCLIK